MLASLIGRSLNFWPRPITNSSLSTSYHWFSNMRYSGRTCWAAGLAAGGGRRVGAGAAVGCGRGSDGAGFGIDPIPGVEVAGGPSTGAGAGIGAGAVVAGAVAGRGNLGAMVADFAATPRPELDAD